MSASVCPFCSEAIPAAAPRCPHCGEHLAARPREARPEGSTQLRVAGALQVFLGGCAALMVPCAALGLFAQSMLPPAQRQSVGAGIAGVMVYAVAAAFLLYTGVGAWQHRRWARPVMLSLSVPGLVMGLIATVSMAFVFPVMMDMSMGMAGAAGGPAPPPPGFMNAVMIMAVVIGGVIWVGLPALFTGLYWSPDLQRACEELDPTPRWTDGVPLPVLGTSLWLGLIAVSSLAIPAYGAAAVFGVLLRGWATVAFALVLAAACAGLAVAVLRRHPLGWVGTLVLVLALGGSWLVSFARLPMIELYRAMDMPPAQLQVLEGLDLSVMNRVSTGAGAAVLAVTVGFLLHARRRFSAS